MNNYKCYFITDKSLQYKTHNAQVIYPELIIIKASDIFQASLKCHEIISNNPEKYLFVHEIEEC